MNALNINKENGQERIIADEVEMNYNKKVNGKESLEMVLEDEYGQDVKLELDDAIVKKLKALLG